MSPERLWAAIESKDLLTVANVLAPVKKRATCRNCGSPLPDHVMAVARDFCSRYCGEDFFCEDFRE